MNTKEYPIHKVQLESGQITQTTDWIINESALYIYLIYWQNLQRHKFHLTTLMRTQGQEQELIIGLLFSEEIIQTLKDITTIAPLSAINNNIWKVELAQHVSFSPEQQQRNMLASSSCGVCSQVNHPSFSGDSQASNGQLPQININTIFTIAKDLSAQQILFPQTGGNHGVALYNLNAKLELLAEDAGRHNACDKIIGQAISRNMLPLNNYCLVFSGRVSFELIHKAQRSAIKIVLALGAPSSLAIDLANYYGITLVGFIRQQKFNIYTHPQRIIN